MKKNYLITIIACLFTLGMTAQPVITYNGNAPQIGDVNNVSGIPYGSTFDPGPAGGGQSWDFSDIQPTLSMSGAAVDAASTPFADDFPEANIAYVNTPSTNTYSYHQITPSELLYVGVGMDPGMPTENINHFPDAIKGMQYPFAFNDTYTDMYFFIFPSDLMLIHERGTITATADAWGSVKTPAGTYNSTLRIKKERVYTDSVWNTGGDLMSVTTHSLTDYEWYTASSHYPVLSIEVTDEGASGISYSSLVGGIEDNALLSQINIYPNPATDRVNIELPEGIIGNTDIYVFDLRGKQVAHFVKTGKGKFVADINALKPGEYVVRVESNNRNQITKKFIKISSR